MKTFNKIFDNIATSFYLMVMVLVTLQIIFRFVLRISVPWTEEISRLIFIYLAFFGGAIAYREGYMIVVDIIPNLLKGRAKSILSLIIYLFSLMYIVIIFIGSIFMVRLAWPTTLATLMWVSNGWLYISMSISFGLMIIYSISPVIKSVNEVVKGGSK